MTLYNNNPQLRQLVALPQTFTLQMFLDLQPTLLLPAAKQHASNLLHTLRTLISISWVNVANLVTANFCHWHNPKLH